MAVEKKVRDAVDMMGEEAAEAEQRVTALKTELNDAQLIQTSLMKEAEQRIAEVRAATEENEGRCEKLEQDAAAQEAAVGQDALVSVVQEHRAEL